MLASIAKKVEGGNKTPEKLLFCVCLNEHAHIPPSLMRVCECTHTVSSTNIVEKKVWEHRILKFMESMGSVYGPHPHRQLNLCHMLEYYLETISHQM